ncbi:MAG: 2-C-methyl-D-erythritol 4-phosphate cytidylyltransferase [Rubrivivax sp.]
MPAAARCFALVPCAGIGERAQAGGRKQYARIAGRSVVAHTLAALAAVREIEAVLVVLAREDQEFEYASAFTGPRSWVARCGGASRAATVANGLAELRARRRARTIGCSKMTHACRAGLGARVDRRPPRRRSRRPARGAVARHAEAGGQPGRRRRRNSCAWAATVAARRQVLLQIAADVPARPAGAALLLRR